MNSMELISIIVPIYNAEKYLKKCIDSIVNQTYHNIEIILVDDGSNDSSLRICNEYAKQDSRIKVLHQSNAGQAMARNRGIECSHGKYIGFVDSDDFLYPNMYERLISLCKEYGCEIAVCQSVDIMNREYPQIPCNKTFKVYKAADLIDGIYDRKPLYNSVP